MKCPRCGNPMSYSPGGGLDSGWTYCPNCRGRASSRDPEDLARERLEERVKSFLSLPRSIYSEDEFRKDLRQAKLSKEDIAEIFESMHDIPFLRKRGMLSSSITEVAWICLQVGHDETPEEKAWHRELIELFEGFMLGKCSREQLINELPNLRGFLQAYSDEQTRHFVKEKLSAAADKILSMLQTLLVAEPSVDEWEEGERRACLRMLIRFGLSEIPRPSTKRSWWKFWR